MLPQKLRTHTHILGGILTILTVTLLSFPLPSLANPVAYPNITINGTTHRFVIVEAHPDNTVSYTINSNTQRIPKNELPLEIYQLILPKPLPTPPPRLTDTEIQKIKLQWSEWGKTIQPVTKKKTLAALPKKENPLIANPTEKAEIQILAQISTILSEGALVQRLKIPEENPPLSMLPFGLSDQIPYKTTLFIEGLQGEKNTQKALSVTPAGEHILAGTKIKKFKLLQELPYPKDEDPPL